MLTQRRGVVFNEADKLAAAMMLRIAAIKGWRSAFLQHSSGYAEVLLLFSPRCIKPAHIVTRLDVRTVAVLDAVSLVAIGRFPTLIDALAACRIGVPGFRRFR